MNSVRIFNAYGTRSRTSGAYGAVFGVFLKQKLAGKPFTVVGDGTQRRDFLYVTDVAAAFLAVALLFPAILSPLNKIWFRFGLLLHHIVNPVILGLIFFIIITPLGLVTKLFGGKLLSLGYDKTAPSYWNRRDPPGPPPESVRNQF